MGMPVSTWVEVDLDRFAANLRAIRGLIGPEREVLLVVKADAYGHGAVEMAEAAEQAGVAHLGVATLHEGIQLRQGGRRLPIVVLSPLLPSEIGEAVRTSSTRRCATSSSRASSRPPRPWRVARCAATSRSTRAWGASASPRAAPRRSWPKWSPPPGVRLASLYTHFPDADADDLGFAREQAARFRSLLERLAARGIRPPRVHASNSAATLNLPEARFDAVRVGLIAYGHRPTRADAALALAPVMSFKSRLVQVRTLPPGTPVSYMRTYVTSRETRMGVVPVGYGHGYSWLLSNRGHN